ncbi:ABC transporter ATP-binding protein [Cellulomonas sp. Sa3CUA2]|uniref:ABC transporter ATP-binding protein n=1 Tax=Cellulomonas avistercoris TaxID=2762242 RepID=A0ABR8QFD1_9CELL|nr:ABC transporter ATP-binding protein [Cellulomonas avistercoris]MBD7919145.1 ABC transporter ATP-binding protein [Cellulomonas avistercoris]
MTLLDLKNLRTYFFVDEGVVKAVDGVDLTIGERETVGVIGESGCGKSTMAHSLLRLIQEPGDIVDGTAWVRLKDGSRQDLFALEPGSEELRAIRGNEVSMVFQEPMASFSPVHTIGSQIAEVLQEHTELDDDEVAARVVDLMRRVGISDPERRVDQYPHEFSGGMRQRAMIALALACGPALLIADEPTTALDVTIQAQILQLLRDLQAEEHMSVLYITHNLGVVAEHVDRVYVMYLGKVVESGPTKELFANPLHPYTRRLLQSVPKPGRRVERLESIEGSVPVPIGLAPQCGFASRCTQAIEGVCDATVPAMSRPDPHRDHEVRCFLYSDVTEDESEWSHV